MAEGGFTSPLKQTKRNPSINDDIEERHTADTSHSVGGQKCIVCFKFIDEVQYIRHVQMCCDSMTMSNKTKPCIICSKTIANKEYASHVNRCLDKSSYSSRSTQPIPRKHSTCFVCKSSFASNGLLNYVMPCGFHHEYCVPCIQKSTEEHIKSKTNPVCFTNVCDYQLSKYDVASLPFHEDMISHLKALVTVERRAQCPKCLFYGEFQTMSKFQKHVVSCDPNDMVSCEFCHCLYRFHELDEHCRYCRNIPVHQRHEAFIDFIISKSKYPFKSIQVRYYIELQKQKRRVIDPHEIINGLAAFEDKFPYKVPTLNCGVCMESYPYEDIFVFGCKDDHKLCYTCFGQSCTAKMNAGEVLTCALCSYQLQHGDINQLRVSRNEKKKFHEYQIQKTFTNFVNNARSIIKCPNQDCQWVVEVRNPNERFRVKCNACSNEFCSICNQQYHYRSSCQEVIQITQRWFVWCNTERRNYWTAGGRKDASCRAQLDDCKKEQEADAKRNEELRRRYEELKADEELKARTCRLCPHCKRVVQHMGGCSSMICGQNYHGGDQQSGCGKSFDWNQALPYIPIVHTVHEQMKNALENQERVVHKGIRCKNCHKEIEGIRFDCIHCHSLNYCEICEQRCSLAHSEELRQQKKQQHVFRLVTTPEPSQK